MSAPVYNLAGELVATGFDDIWDGSISAAITSYQTGAQPSDLVFAWTGSNSQGYAAQGFAATEDEPLGTPEDLAAMGMPGETNRGWITEYSTTSSNNWHMYALSSVITVPNSETTPEPASVITWAFIGTVGCVGTWWNRRRKAG